MVVTTWSEPIDSMDDKVDKILAQLAVLVEEIWSTKEEMCTVSSKDDEHDKLFEKHAAYPNCAHTVVKGKSAEGYQEHDQP